MKASEFIEKCRSLIGMPYNKCDCIGVIRKALNIRCANTNWLWRSTRNAEKYRYLSETTTDVKNHVYHAGELVFKIRNKVPKGYNEGVDCYHVGVVARNDDGLLTVIHSSPITGVREENLRLDEWDAVGGLSVKLIKQYDDAFDNFAETNQDCAEFPVIGSTCKCPACGELFTLKWSAIID